MPMQEAFDVPPTTQSCERRMTTTVATQALQLLNDAFTNEQADFMARDIHEIVGNDRRRQIAEVYWRTLSRPPTKKQVDTTEKFLRVQAGYHQQRLAATASNLQLELEANISALSDLCHVM